MLSPLRQTDRQAGAKDVRARLKLLIDQGLAGTDGRLPSERELCETLGVGRRTLSAALQMLEAEGLIWRRQGKGTFLGLPPEPTQVLAAEIVGQTNIVEVMEARLCIEPVLAAMCARNARPEDIERMRALARRIVEAKDTRSIETWDSALHRLIARTAGNKPLLTAFSMIDEIRNNPDWLGRRSRARSTETLKVSDHEHRVIIDRIEAGDAAGAEAAMRAHLTTLADNIRRSPGT